MTIPFNQQLYIEAGLINVAYSFLDATTPWSGQNRTGFNAASCRWILSGASCPLIPILLLPFGGLHLPKTYNAPFD